MLARTRFVIHVHLHVDYTKTFAKGQSQFEFNAFTTHSMLLLMSFNKNEPKLAQLSKITIQVMQSNQKYRNYR